MINGVGNKKCLFFNNNLFYPEQVFSHFAFFDPLLKSKSNATSKLESPHNVIETHKKSLFWSEEERNKFNGYSK